MFKMEQAQRVAEYDKLIETYYGTLPINDKGEPDLVTRTALRKHFLNNDYKDIQFAYVNGGSVLKQKTTVNKFLAKIDASKRRDLHLDLVKLQRVKPNQTRIAVLKQISPLSSSMKAVSELQNEDFDRLSPLPPLAEQMQTLNGLLQKTLQRARILRSVNTRPFGVLKVSIDHSMTIKPSIASPTSVMDR